MAGLQDEIEREVFSRTVTVDTTASWVTPSGNPRKAPVYEAVVVNEHLGKSRTLKNACLMTLKKKANECLTTWAHQEVRARVTEAQRDAKEQAQAEAARLDEEAKQSLDEVRRILHVTLSVDDKIDWEAQQDTRAFDQFSYPPEPQFHPLPHPVMPPKPAFTWLLRGRLRRWQSECENAREDHERASTEHRALWEKSVQAHQIAMDRARRKHAALERDFVSAQKRYNEALKTFQAGFEAGDPSAIVEYCSRVFELSQYPDLVSLSHSVSYDEEAGFITVALELPTENVLPPAGYKFIAKGNCVEPVALKKKESAEIYDSMLDQIILRTLHEIFEGCYTPHVRGALVSGFVTNVNPATGLDERKLLRSVAVERDTFNALDLAKIDPAACIKGLAASMGNISSSGAA